MYQMNGTELTRERHRILLREAEKLRLARRLRARRRSEVRAGGFWGALLAFSGRSPDSPVIDARARHQRRLRRAR